MRLRERTELQKQPVARSKDRFGQMGGEKGSSIIMGGFHGWSRRAVLERAFEDVKKQLHLDLYHRIEKVVFPGTRGHLLNIDLVCEDSPRETRLEMFAFVKKFRETNVKVRIGDQDYEIWTAAARPPATRAQDRSLTMAVQICKKLLANVGNVEELVGTRCSQGRIWWEDALIAQRSYQNPEKVDFRLGALQKLDKNITEEGVEKGAVAFATLLPPPCLPRTRAISGFWSSLSQSSCKEVTEAARVSPPAGLTEEAELPRGKSEEVPGLFRMDLIRLPKVHRRGKHHV